MIDKDSATYVKYGSRLGLRKSVKKRALIRSRPTDVIVNTHASDPLKPYEERHASVPKNAPLAPLVDDASMDDAENSKSSSAAE
jgi:hypothetical protein